jgi:5-guanidino-2-oxopentanoate decarboxylase
MKQHPTCGQALLRLLDDYDVDIVFGIPGVHTLELYRGLADSPIRHVLARHEQGAAFMADGYARITGKPGVCFLITGPGVTNASTAIAQAYSDSVPMLVLTSVNRSDTLGRGWGELHELADQQAVTAPFTAFGASVREPQELPGLMEKAFKVFDGQRPRPVHIEVPIDVLAMTAKPGWAARRSAGPPKPPQQSVKEALRVLGKARRPLIYAGGGAKRAAGEVRGIAERIAAPVVTTVAGIGMLPDDHPLNLGATLPSEATLRLVADADVVLAAGTELSENDTWGRPLEINGALIRIDIDPQKLGDRFLPEVAVHGDARLALKAIMEALTNAGDDDRPAAEARVRGARVAFQSTLGESERKHQRILELVQRVAPRETVYVGDMTQIVYTAYRCMAFDAPARFFNPKGYGTLGYALPAAIGARLGAPETPLVALTGDSGVLYTIQEMATATDEGASVVVLLWNNQSLGAIGDGFKALGIEPIETTPWNPDYQELARAFGWNATRARDPAALETALKNALAAEGPTLIEINESDDF